MQQNVWMTLAATCFAGSVTAAPITIDFDVSSQNLPYVENGFSVTGSEANYQIVDTVLNPIPFDVGDEVRFERQSGDTFQFTSFDLYRHNSGHSTFALLGYLNDVQIADFGTFALGGGEFFQTLNTGSVTLIDELRMVGTGLRGGGLALDNFVFDIDRNPAPVPLPASLGFMLGIAGALGGLFRLRAKA